jgi:hypothetical protein
MSDAIYGLAGPPPDPPVISGSFRPFGKDGFSFKALLDVINPLQHIPIVSGAYRLITGEEIGFVPRVLGGALFGGPIGLIAGLVNAIVKEASGQDLGETALALATDDASSYVAAKPNADPAQTADSSARHAAAPVAVATASVVQPGAPGAIGAAARNVAAGPGLWPGRGLAKSAAASPPSAANPMLHFRIPTVAEPATSAAADMARRAPGSVEIPDRSPDWFLRSLSQGLDKYDRAAKLDRGEGARSATRIYS